MVKEGIVSGTMAMLMVMCVGLGGCSLSGAVKGALSGNSTPSDTYDLVLDTSQIKRGSRLDTQIVVASPVAVRSLASDKILVKPAATQITYYGRSVYSDRLPKLLQARMIEALTASGRFRAVSDGRDRISGDVTLASTIEAFQVEVNGEQARANVSVFVKLIHISSGKVYASRKFISQIPASNREVAGGVEALNSAMNEVLVKITRWAVKRGRLRVQG